MTTPGAPTDPATEAIADHPAVRRVAQALASLGIESPIRVLPGNAKTAALAAEQLGIEVAQIANSLVFAVDPADLGPAVLVLTSGRHRVDTAMVAGLMGAAGIGRADADLVRAATGFAIGGVSPVGHPAPLPTYVDVALRDYDEVWAAAGHPHAVFRTTFDDLVRMTRGTPAVVSAD